MNVKEMLNRIDYRSFYQKHIPGFEASGKTQVKIPCVFHEEKTASLSINLDTGEFHCFGGSCGKEGGAVKFLQLCYGLDKKGAIKRFRRKPEIHPLPPPAGDTRKPKQKN